MLDISKDLMKKELKVVSDTGYIGMRKSSLKRRLTHFWP